MNWLPSPIMITAQRTLGFLLPPRCAMCRRRINEHGHLCSKCWAALTPIADPKCARCALPFAFADDQAKVCGTCLHSQPVFDAASAPVLYDDKGRDLVLALKHGGMFSAVPVMARMMAAQFMPDTNRAVEIDMIIPVPLHWTRLLKRRFNQSQLLARDIGGIIGVSVNVGLLKRVKETPSQGTFGRKKRFANVSGAFAVVPERADQVIGKNILLVDDVLTTGATVSACADALKKAGANHVHVAAFARVGKPIAA